MYPKLKLSFALSFLVGFSLYLTTLTYATASIVGSPGYQCAPIPKDDCVRCCRATYPKDPYCLVTCDPLSTLHE